MQKKITMYYILSNLKRDRIMSCIAELDTNVLNDLFHLHNDYYIGFSGFGNDSMILETPIEYDFYYFYNMVEDIRTILGVVKFDKEMSCNDLLIFELNRLKNLNKQRLLINKCLKEELVKYRKYIDEMNYWILKNGSGQLKLRFQNDEDVELSYLIERVASDNATNSIL
jgi:hypothetical protein